MLRSTHKLAPLARQIARTSLPTASCVAPPARSSVPRAPRARGLHASAVTFKTKLPSSGKVTYDQVKELSDQPSDDVLIIDVREPDETIYGAIPSSVNLPLSQLEKGLKLEEGNFQKTFAFAKPVKSQRIITYCKAGVRSNTAVNYFKEKGYKNVLNYEGSFDDWTAKESAAH